jgi:hypothetical protein
LFIGILTIVALIGVIIFAALGQTEGTAFGIVVGILTTGVAGLADASAVEARRRDPSVAAIADDIRKAEDPHDAVTKPGV